MPPTPVFTYSGGGLNPLYDTARCDSVALRAGKSYEQGRLLGHVPGTGTAANEVQRITVTGTPTGGGFYLRYGTLLSALIPYNSTAAAVKTILEAVFGAGNVNTSGGALPGTAVDVTFQGEAAGLPHDLMTTINAFTGGTAPAAAVTRQTVGKPAGGFFDVYNDSATDGTQTAKRILKYPYSVNHLGVMTMGDTPDVDRFFPQRGAAAYFQGHFRVTDLVGLDANAVADLGRLINGNAITDPNAVLAVTGAG